MKKFIKLLSVFMVLAMLLATFAACSDKGNGDGTDTSDTQSDVQDTSPSTPDDGGAASKDEDVIKILNAESFWLLIDSINKDPSTTKGRTYKLMVDIDIFVGWDAAPSEKLGKFVPPDAVTQFAGINEFYGVFDGNGKTISSVYMASQVAADSTQALFKKLNGGTIKNLNVNTAFVYDNGGNGAVIGGLVGIVNGENAVIDNVTVNTNVYSAADAATVVGGVVGRVTADNLTLNKVTFGGRVGNVGADLNISSPSTSAILGQLIADGGDKKITMTDCNANGAIIANDGATKDEFCAVGAANLTKNGCTVNAPADGGGVSSNVIEIYTAEELKTLAALGSDCEGKTVKLMKNINLNQDWTASETAPASVWQGIAEFKGVFDGNNKVLRGIYRSASNAENVGFIDVLNGGTVKDLMIFNSAFVASSDTQAANVGFIGSVNGGTVSNVYSEAKLYFTGAANANVGGIAGAVSGSSTVNDVVFVGAVSATGKTADLIANGTATYTNVLAIGTGADTAVTGTCVLSERKDETFLEGNTEYAEWTYSQYLGAIAPQSISELLRYLKLTADTSWYNETDTTFEISTAEQLLGLSELGQTNSFEGKTIKLTDNIDLNPNWDATTNVSSGGTVTLADTPNNVWKPIPTFKGTIDGNGKRISGIYSLTDFEVPATSLRYLGGFINELIDGTIKDLIIDNSLSVFESSTATGGTAKIRIGGFISHVVDSTLTTLYVDMDAWMRFSYQYTMGGLISSVDTAQAGRSYVGSISDIVYAGSTGRICSDGTYSKNEGTSRIYCAGMIGQNHEAQSSGESAKEIGLTMQNLAFIGICYRPSCQNVSGDALMAYTGSGNYNNGLATNNCVIYTNETAFGKDVGAINTAEGTELSAVAKDFKNNKSTVTDNDTYGDTGWTAVKHENGAGFTGDILLPTSVVNMLNANVNG